MAHKITRNITQVNDIKKLGMNVTNECDLVSDGTNVYVRVGKEYRQIDNEEIQEIDMTEYYKKNEVDKKINNIEFSADKISYKNKDNSTSNVQIAMENRYTKLEIDARLKKITERLTALENTNESE